MPMSVGVSLAFSRPVVSESSFALILPFSSRTLCIRDRARTVVSVDIASRRLNFKDLKVLGIFCNVDLRCGHARTLLELCLLYTSDSLAAETYANIVAVKEGNEDTEKTKALIEALQSDVVRDYIEATYDGAVIPKF